MLMDKQVIQNLSGEYLNPRTQVMQGQAYIAKKKRGYHNTTKKVLALKLDIVAK